METDDFVSDSVRLIKNILLPKAKEYSDTIDKEERKSEDDAGYFGYLKFFLIDCGILCDDIAAAARNDAVLLAFVGARTLVEDTINANYLDFKGTLEERVKVSKDWYRISNDPAAIKNQLDGKSVKDRAMVDDGGKRLYEGEYAMLCSYTHGNAQRSLLNVASHRILGQKKVMWASIKAYANIIACVADIIGEPAPTDVLDQVKTYLDKYKESVAEATLPIDLEEIKAQGA